jgi:16S rRNA (adenine1518-N6/adenine1519-N6)-dimethyltransferase
MYIDNFLDVDLDMLKPHAPWVMLSNLPYHITFPILHRVYKYRELISEGVLMMQEEVAQKIVKTHGRGYGYVSLFFQYYFDWNLLSKVPPTAFYPHPKVFSRLIQFTTKKQVEPIPHEKEFWRFIKFCFLHPRRTLKNNLMQTHIPIDAIDQDILQLRAQQMSMTQFLALWTTLHSFFVKIGEQ